MMRRHVFALAGAALLGLSSAQAQSGDAARGKEKSAACAACHGERGNSASPAFPHLGGQYEDYLYVAMRDYQSGRRKNPIMVAQVQNLSAQDLRDLAAYYAQQDGLYQKR